MSPRSLYNNFGKLRLDFVDIALILEQFHFGTFYGCQSFFSDKLNTSNIKFTLRLLI